MRLFGFFFILILSQMLRAQEAQSVFPGIQAFYKNLEMKAACISQSPDANCDEKKLSAPLQLAVISCQEKINSNFCKDVIKKEPEFSQSLKQCRPDQFCKDYLAQEKNWLKACGLGYLEGLGEQVSPVAEILKTVREKALEKLNRDKVFNEKCSKDFNCRKLFVSDIPKFQNMSDENLAKYSFNTLLIERQNYDNLIATYKRQGVVNKIISDRTLRSEKLRQDQEDEMTIQMIKDWLNYKGARLECFDAETQGELICWGASYFINGPALLKAPATLNAVSRGARFVANILRDERVATETSALAENAIKIEQRSRFVHPPTDVELYGERIGYADYPNLPPAIKIAKYRDLGGREYLALEQPVKLPSGEVVMDVPREIPIDPLTGAFNSRTPVGKELLSQMIKQGDGKVTLEFFDINNLGYIKKNFAKGFESGNELVKTFAETLNRATNGKAELFRNGGDEFILIIHETDPAKVKQITDTIFQDVKNGPMSNMFKNEEAKLRSAYDEAKDGDGMQPAAIYHYNSGLRYTQPGVSVGAVTANPLEPVESIIERAEQQATDAKIAFKKQVNIDATKYGGEKSIPAAPPNTDYVPTAQAPLGKAVIEGPAPRIPLASEASRAMKKEERIREINRFGDTKIAEYRTEKGDVILRQEIYTRLPDGSVRKTMREIVLNQVTGNIEAGTEHGQEILKSLIQSSTPSQPKSIVQIKMENFGPLNYFANKSAAGDSVMKAINDVVQKYAKPNDLHFQKGPDILFTTNAQSTKGVELQIQNALLKDPRIRKVIEDQRVHLRSELAANKNDVIKARELKKALADLDARLENFQVTGTPVHAGDDLESIYQRLTPPHQ